MTAEGKGYGGPYIHIRSVQSRLHARGRAQTRPLVERGRHVVRRQPAARKVLLRRLELPVVLEGAKMHNNSVENEIFGGMSLKLLEYTRLEEKTGGASGAYSRSV